MKKILLLLVLFNSSFFIFGAYAEKPHGRGAKKKTEESSAKTDTAVTGIYITSIHDIDFRQKQYAITFWLWFRYKNPDLDFYKYLEIPQAKSMTITYNEIDTSKQGIISILLKVQCVMKDSWKINNFPFDRQNLRLTIENAQCEIEDLVFVKDTMGKSYDVHALSGYGSDSLAGWIIDPDSFKISIGKKEYETAFDDTVKPPTAYSTFKVKIGIKHEAWGLFWKVFLGMYVSFLIAFVCFFIHADSIDSRFGLSVGALFAVIGNKYIIESSLPESSSFTLVDTLHGLTLFFILTVIASSGYVLNLIKNDKIKQANKFDWIVARVSVLVYIIFNVYFILQANRG
jgi:hypothetical protein